MLRFGKSYRVCCCHKIISYLNHNFGHKQDSNLNGKSTLDEKTQDSSLMSLFMVMVVSGFEVNSRVYEFTIYCNETI